MAEPYVQSPAPDAPIRKVIDPITRFMHVEAASGVVLLACAVIAFALANSPWHEAFLGFWKHEVGFRLGGFAMHHSLKHWINDGLMAVFFFVVGLEVKRELVAGELRDPRRAVLPVAAAFGGMVVPAAIYFALQSGTEHAHGWAVPMATDIAFVVGCLALLGDRVPRVLRATLLSLAIVDDIGAILVIAFVFTSGLNLTALLLGLAGLGAVVGLRKLGVRHFSVYTVAGVLVWVAFHESGIHATIAGVVLGLLTPLEPLEHLEEKLHPWTSFVVMPVFALANAGVPFQVADLGDPVALAVAAGLVLGKPLGVLLAAFVVVKLVTRTLPEGLTWRIMLGAGALAGIGFTMSLFIANLALDEPGLGAAKVGVLGASVLAATLGMLTLRAVLPGRSG